MWMRANMQKRKYANTQTLIIKKLHTGTYDVRICACQRAYSKIMKMGGVARRSLATFNDKYFQ